MLLDGAGESRSDRRRLLTIVETETGAIARRLSARGADDKRNGVKSTSFEKHYPKTGDVFGLIPRRPSDGRPQSVRVSRSRTFEQRNDDEKHWKTIDSTDKMRRNASVTTTTKLESEIMFFAPASLPGYLFRKIENG